MGYREPVSRTHPFWAEVAGDAPLPPAATHLGLRFLEAEPQSGRILVEFAARAEFTNPHGQVQGGFLAAMLDDTLMGALATLLEPNEFATTLEIKVSFLRAAGLGKLRGEGRVVRRGRSVAFLEGSLHSESGEEMATASATARILERRT